MTAPARRRRGTPLVDLLDRVIDRGAVVGADALIGLAAVDLIRIALRLVIVPADRAPDAGTVGRTTPPPIRAASPAQVGPVATRPPAATPLPPGPAIDRDEVGRGLAQLVLTLVELLRELLDRQAVRRTIRGGLTDEQVERLGLALLDLDRRMDELAAVFDVDRQDLNLDLGPLGDLL